MLIITIIKNKKSQTNATKSTITQLAKTVLPYSKEIKQYIYYTVTEFTASQSLSQNKPASVEAKRTRITPY